MALKDWACFGCDPLQIDMPDDCFLYAIDDPDDDGPPGGYFVICPHHGMTDQFCARFLAREKTKEKT